jgi:RimJ/RimL family protein N-acetyltransferase
LKNLSKDEMLENMVKIQGHRIILRDWLPGEVDAMHRWFGDPDVTRFLSWGAGTIEDSARHLAECIAQQELLERERYFLAIELRASGRVIGDAGFQWIRRKGQQREGGFGYFLERSYWGKGYGTEAARLVLALAFGELGATVMRASCNARNVASERVMQKCGMLREPEQEPPGRRAYRILSDEWPGGPENPEAAA